MQIDLLQCLAMGANHIINIVVVNVIVNTTTITIDIDVIITNTFLRLTLHLCRW